MEALWVLQGGYRLLFVIEGQLWKLTDVQDHCYTKLHSEAMWHTAVTSIAHFRLSCVVSKQASKALYSIARTGVLFM